MQQQSSSSLLQVRIQSHCYRLQRALEDQRAQDDRMELMVEQHNKLINRMDDLYEDLEKERESSIQLSSIKVGIVYYKGKL